MLRHPTDIETIDAAGNAPQESAADGVAALTELTHHYRRAYEKLYRQALSVVCCPHTAHDVVQEAFVDTTTKIVEGGEIRNLDAWMHAVVRNNCRNRISTRRARNRACVPLDEELLEGTESAADVAHLRLQCEEVGKVLDDLTPAQRSAFLLAELRGLDYAEIADALNRTENSVRQLLARARQSVRNAVGPTAGAWAIPAIPLEALRRLWPDKQIGVLRNYVSAKLASVQASIASLGQRAGDIASQPAAAAIAGILAAGALAAGLGGDTADSSERASAAPPAAVSPLAERDPGSVDGSAADPDTPPAQPSPADASPVDADQGGDSSTEPAAPRASGSGTDRPEREAVPATYATQTGDSPGQEPSGDGGPPPDPGSHQGGGGGQDDNCSQLGVVCDPPEELSPPAGPSAPEKEPLKDPAPAGDEGTSGTEPIGGGFEPDGSPRIAQLAVPERPSS